MYHMALLDWLKMQESPMIAKADPVPPSRPGISYAHIAPILLISLVFSFIKPGSVHGQSDSAPCVQQMNRVHAAYQPLSEAFQRRAVLSLDSLSYVAGAARKARECFGEVHPARRIWLLHRETWTLDRLGRYREASGLVEHFFEDLKHEAGPLYEARFALWQIPVPQLRGRLRRDCGGVGGGV